MSDPNQAGPTPPPRRRLEARGAIEVYVSDHGFVCIKEIEGLDGRDDAIVAMHPTDVPTIIEWLRECMREAEE